MADMDFLMGSAVHLDESLVETMVEEVEKVEEEQGCKWVEGKQRPPPLSSGWWWQVSPGPGEP